MRRLHTALATALAFLAVLGGCGGEDAQHDLFVDLRTDLRPGTDFVAVRTRVFDRDAETHTREIVWNAPAEGDLSLGVRIAEIGGLPSGPKRVQVALISRLDVEAAGATAIIDLRQSEAVSVLVSRSCIGVSCPAAGDSADLASCVGGQCVTEACAAGVEDACDRPRVALADVPRLFAVTACGRLAECSGAQFAVAWKNIDCEAAVTQGIEDRLLPLWSDALARGTMVYHPDRATLCFEVMAQAGCSTVGGSGAAVECFQMMTGTVGPGGECLVDAECAGLGTYCATTDACPGHCAERLQEGAECARDDECMREFRCDNHLCRPYGLVGQACRPFGYEGNYPQCGLDLFCAGPADGPGMCVPIEDVYVGAEGEACDLFTGPTCAEGLSCGFVVEGMTSTTRCVAPSESLGTCTAALPDTCPPGQYCEHRAPMLEGTCRTLPVAPEPCVDLPLIGVPCAPGYACDWSIPAGPTCVAFQGPGQRCTTDFSCTTGNCQEGVCQDLPCVR